MINLRNIVALAAMLALAAPAWTQSSPGLDREPAVSPGTVDRNAEPSGSVSFGPGAAAPAEPPSLTPQGQAESQNSASVNSPKRHFVAARSSFEQRDFAAAASHLRQGAGILRTSAARAYGDVADDLRATAQEIEKVAGRVQRGEVNRWEEVNEKVAESYRNLADFHYQVARAGYDRDRKSGAPAGRDPETGNALNAAADNLEDWARATGRTLNAGTRSAVSGTRDLAGRMISGTGWVAEQAGEAINNFGEAIRSFGRGVVGRDRDRERDRNVPPAAVTEPAHPVDPNAADPGRRY